MIIGPVLLRHNPGSFSQWFPRAPDTVYWFPPVFIEPTRQVEDGEAGKDLVIRFEYRDREPSDEQADE